MLEGLRRPSAPRGAGGGRAWRLRAGADGWLAGQRQPGLAAALSQAGFSHVLVVERDRPVDIRAVEADLGPPVYPGVYALDPSEEQP